MTLVICQRFDVFLTFIIPKTSQRAVKCCMPRKDHLDKQPNRDEKLDLGVDQASVVQTLSLSTG